MNLNISKQGSVLFVNSSDANGCWFRVAWSHDMDIYKKAIYVLQSHITDK